MIRLGWLLLLAISVAVSAATPPQTPELEFGELGIDGYRDHNFRSPTPLSVPDGWTVDTTELQRLVETDSPVLIDVQPTVLRPATDRQSAEWLPSQPRYHLPGSHWLPNVGYPELTPPMAAYFRHSLKKLTHGDQQRVIVFYCIADCWFSWNAVKRAASYGYRNLYWYRDGTDGWQESGLPLVKAEPEPLEAY